MLDLKQVSEISAQKINFFFTPKIWKADYQSIQGFKECTLPPNNIKQAILQHSTRLYTAYFSEALKAKILIN